MSARLYLLLPCWVACGGPKEADTAKGSPWPEVACPGGPGCATNRGPLRAGVARRSVVPACYESWTDLNGDGTWSPVDESWLDCGCDRLCPEDAGYPGPDEGEGDETFQAVWLGGFGQGRPASGVRGAGLGLRGEGDGLWATALVLEQGDTRLGLVALDALGWMRDDVLLFRAEAADLGLDHLIIHSTHTHEGPDTMGMWGPNLTTAGRDPAYVAQTSAAIREALTEALETLTPVSVSAGLGDLREEPGGIANLIEDTRDPFIADPFVRVAQFSRVDDGRTVATLVNWANHPETVGSRNTLYTSDFAHALRATVEDGVTWPSASQPGVGGLCLFLNGALGGMMTSLGAPGTDPDGQTWPSASFEKADTIGQIAGGVALRALSEAEPVLAPDLAFAGRTFQLPIDNLAFQTVFLLGVLQRQAFDYDPELPLSEENKPDVEVELNWVRLGDWEWLTFPGEVLPELILGGYDGSFGAAGRPLVDPANPNPPDLARAPAGPYWLDQLDTTHRWVLGLANDEVGYIVPPYDFQVAEVGPYLNEVEGDHYEETNSLGPQTAPLIEAELDALVDFAHRELR